ncbi:HNH endonuclease [Vibrio phage VBP32]|uniref:HNH endonuclease n=2 Tax=Stoningtonvirus VBP47 TaxID=2846606 RepID=M4T2H2_9CAUD|nr:HNH endonuclease [Vibrio phage VBP47]YP_007676495.1 HNH endonuclease [Vibrio phage VBP32]AGH57034.1 HNH endonuclease [Vibrio phage VBP47]AGH57144.1 HNH endonuclease [Vibrio phage VBP32]
MVNLSILREWLDYSPVTGEFHWKKSSGPLKAGTTAGKLKSNGYISIRLKGKDYYAHRLAWLFVHGTLPDNKMVDHINHNKTDNRIVNLRLATPTQNRQNSKALGSSGVKNVYAHRHGNWIVRFKVDGKNKSFGIYSSLKKAKEVAEDQRKILHEEFACDH